MTKSSCIRCGHSQKDHQKTIDPQKDALKPGYEKSLGECPGFEPVEEDFSSDDAVRKAIQDEQKVLGEMRPKRRTHNW